MTELELYWKELCERTGIEDNDSNYPDIVALRYIFYDYARNEKSANWKTIDDIVGRDHSTAITGLKTYYKLMSVNDPYLLQMISRVDSKKGYQVVNGDKIYVPSSYHVYRGEDDFEGGLATINKVEHSNNLPKDHVNYTMVGIEENISTMYNYRCLAEEQDELKKIYVGKIAHSSPDLRAEFNQPNADWE